MAHAQAHPPPPLEALSLDDQRAGAGGQGPAPALGQALHPQQAPQQLPPQMFTTAAQLLDLTDSELHHRSGFGRRKCGWGAARLVLKTKRGRGRKTKGKEKRG